MILIKKIPKVIWSKKVKAYCALPYSNHRKGCPNFNKKVGCPLKNPNINEIININKPVYLIGIDFDLNAQRLKIHRLHPDWTPKQCGNLRYWQAGLRKRLRQIVNTFIREKHQNLVSDYLPEGHGVDITNIMKKMGEFISWNYPLNYIWQVVLVGEPIKC